MEKKETPQNTPTAQIQRLPDLSHLVQRLDGMPSSNGIRTLKKHYLGVHLSYKQRCAAKCCECSGYYIDGRQDCEMPSCPIYPTMPYRADRKKRERT
jgi:hypothetical protein